MVLSTWTDYTSDVFILTIIGHGQVGSQIYTERMNVFKL